MMDTINDFARQAAESQTISDVASKVTIVGGTGTSIYSMLGGDVAITVIGIVCTIGTFIINWVFKKREHTLNERRLEMEFKMQMLAEQRRQKVADAQIEAMQSGYIHNITPDTTRGTLL